MIPSQAAVVLIGLQPADGWRQGETLHYLSILRAVCVKTGQAIYSFFPELQTFNLLLPGLGLTFKKIIKKIIQISVF